MLASMVIWGGTWPAGKVAAVATPPERIVFWRFVLTAAALAPALAMRSLNRSPVTPFALSRRSWLFVAAAAVSLVGYNELFLWGVRLGLASAGGIVVPTLSPVVTFLVMAAAGRRRPGPLAVLGVLLGLAGGAVILRVWQLDLGDLGRSGNLFFLAAALVWTSVTICSQRAQEGAGFIPVSLAIYAIAAACALPVALATGGVRPPATASFWLLVTYLAVAATSFATTVYFFASSRLGSARASSFMFVVPLGAVLLSWLFLAERPDVLTLAGGVLSIGAVYLVNSGR